MATKTNDFMGNARQIGDELMKTSRNFYLFGLGAVAEVEEQARGLFDRFVSKGEAFEKTDKNLIHVASDKAREVNTKVQETVSDTVASTLNRAGVPSRDEIRTLIARVEELNAKVETLGAK